jgi:hypothetical protein
VAEIRQFQKRESDETLLCDIDLRLTLAEIPSVGWPPS